MCLFLRSAKRWNFAKVPSSGRNKLRIRNYHHQHDKQICPCLQDQEAQTQQHPEQLQCGALTPAVKTSCHNDSPQLFASRSHISPPVAWLNLWAQLSKSMEAATLDNSCQESSAWTLNAATWLLVKKSAAGSCHEKMASMMKTSDILFSMLKTYNKAARKSSTV